MEQSNIQVLLREVNWLESVIFQAITTYLMQEGHENSWLEIEVPNLDDGSVYGNRVEQWGLNNHERLLLALAMAPHIKPQALDVFFGKNGVYDRQFTEFGGVLDKNHSGFFPTGQTFVFILTSNFPDFWGELGRILDQDHVLFKEGVLQVADVEALNPKFNGALSIS